MKKHQPLANLRESPRSSFSTELLLPLAFILWTALTMVDHCSCPVAALEQPACSGLKQHVLIKRHSHLDSNEREKHCQNQWGKRKLPDYFCLGFFAELTFFVSPFGTRTASSLEGHRNLIAATVIKSQRGIDSGVNRPSMEAAGRTQSLLFL